MNTGTGSTLTELEFQLALLEHDAKQAMERLAEVAKHCADEELRRGAIGALSRIGAVAALELVNLAERPDRKNDVYDVAAHSSNWPIFYSIWPSDRERIDSALPSGYIGSGKDIQPGRWSLDVVANKWAFAFVQQMGLVRVAVSRFPDLNEARDYIAENYNGLDVKQFDVVLGAKLPRFCRANLSIWVDALKEYLGCHFPKTDLAEHTDWRGEWTNTSKDKVSKMGNDPWEMKSWIIGRIVRSLTQLAN